MNNENEIKKSKWTSTTAIKTLEEKGFSVVKKVIFGTKGKGTLKTGSAIDYLINKLQYTYSDVS